MAQEKSVDEAKLVDEEREVEVSVESVPHRFARNGHFLGPEVDCRHPCRRCSRLAHQWFAHREQAVVCPRFGS